MIAQLALLALLTVCYADHPPLCINPLPAIACVTGHEQVICTSGPCPSLAPCVRDPARPFAWMTNGLPECQWQVACYYQFGVVGGDYVNVRYADCASSCVP